MTNRELAAQVKDKWLGVRMTCTYNDKPRDGTVIFIKQGPACKKGETFIYLGEESGAVYIDFVAWSDKKLRCFLWKKVVDPQVWAEEVKWTTETIRVARPRPIA